MSVGAVHLRPRSAARQRVWRVGGAKRGAGHGLRLDVCPDRHAAFASLDSILRQLEPHATPAEQAAFARIARYMEDARPGDGAETSRGRLLADSVTFAVMRRVSRESFYTARIIDLSARTMNAVLARQPHACVCVEHADRLDRPTLKVLARAMLLLGEQHAFTWVWQLDSDPMRANAGPPDLFLASREALMRQLLALLDPVLERNGDMPLAARPEDDHAGDGIETMAAELVVQNYDRCFLLSDRLLGRADDAQASEIRRLTGLAAVNVGRLEDALDRLAEAEAGAGVGRQAHLAYLRGLIEAKRRYNLSTSNAHYERGLQLLDTSRDDGADVALERGWLLNGLALNESILWRRENGSNARHAKAFALEQEAFALVREGASPARMYLRFNLLANSALLMEMLGEYGVAIDLFTKTFDDMDAEASKQSRWETTMGYRIGLLRFRAGQLAEAYELLHRAAERDDAIESWPTRERVLRALGTVALEGGAPAEATAIFGVGLELCREARAAEGAQHHARGLIAAQIADGRSGDAAETAAELAAEEGFAFDEPLDAIAPPSPSPKLPPYFPEIDLEGIPAIDLNRYLGTEPAVSLPTPWTG